jgi:hypothetical protein
MVSQRKLTGSLLPVPFVLGGFAPSDPSARVSVNVVVVLSLMQGAEAQSRK